MVKTISEQIGEVLSQEITKILVPYIKKTDKAFAEANDFINALAQINFIVFVLLYKLLPEMRVPVRNLLESPPPSTYENNRFYIDIIKILRGTVEDLDNPEKQQNPDWFRGVIIGGLEKNDKPENEDS